MGVVVLPSEYVKAILSVMKTECMGIDTVTFVVEDGLLSLNHRNLSGTAMATFDTLEKDDRLGENTRFSIELSDLKSISSLAKEKSITLNIYSGKITCTVGSVRKTFPISMEENLCDKKLRVPFPNEMTLTEEQLGTLLTSLSGASADDITLKVIDDKVVVQFGDNLRSTEIEIPKSEIETANFTKNSFSGFDRVMFESMLKAKPKDSSINMRFGESIPIKTTFLGEKFAASIILAPKIYED